MDPYKIIAGKQFKHSELKNFTPERWLALFHFFELFLVPYTTAEGKLTEKFNLKQADLEKYADDLTYKEFYWRTSMGEDVKSTNKIDSICLNVLSFLKKNPAYMNEEMKSFITIRHPIFWGWCLKQYDVLQTPAGEIVTRETETSIKREGENLPSLNAKMMGSLVKLADIYENLASSVSTHDYRTLTAVEKFKALKDLSFIFQAASKKVAPSSFTQVNINTVGVRDAEKALLDFVTKK